MMNLLNVIFNGEPWFKGHDVASILGYAQPRNAIRDHVPEKENKHMKV